MAELQLLRGDDVVYVHPVGPAPVHLGRASTNDLVLADPRVSSRHAVVWAEAGAFWVEDLASRNGTSLDGRSIQGRAQLDDGAVLELGGRVRVRLVGTPDEVPAAGGWVVEDRTSGVRVPVRTDRFRIGSAARSDLCLPDGPARAGTLLVHPDEVWLGTDDGEVEVAPGVAFEVGGRELVLVPAGSGRTRTEGVEATLYPYRLQASLDGPEAVLEDADAAIRHVVRAENRATLLWVLGRRRLDDLASGVAETDRGWLGDEEVGTAVWGRERHAQEPNNLHVLVHRLRKELAGAGLDPWFLEKRRRQLRVRLDRLQIE